MAPRATQPWFDRAVARLAGLFWLEITRQTTRREVARLIDALRPLHCEPGLIRLGPESDGGYLVPDDLDGIRFAFSPGIAAESGFERDLADRGIEVYLADAAVAGPARDHPGFTFIKKHVGASTSDATMTLDDWKRGSIGDGSEDLLLQMDIEGAEYEALWGLSASLQAQFRIMVVEFHQLDRLWSRPQFETMSKVFRKLLETHSVVHIHPNNCCGSFTRRGFEIPRLAEFTFLRNDRISDVRFATGFPHPLDRDNVVGDPLPLSPVWYRDRKALS